MPVTGKLKALNVAREKRAGLYGDGGGLYLQITASGAKSWIFRYWVAERDAATGALVRDPISGKTKGRSRDMGLGSFANVSLAEARDHALECRKLRENEIDPIEAREAARREAALERTKSLKFKDAAEAYITAHRVAWTNDKHAGQWRATLKAHAYPVVGELPVQLIDTTLVMKVIEPLWSKKPETASRLRGRIESVLDWATVRGYRQGRAASHSFVGEFVGLASKKLTGRIQSGAQGPLRSNQIGLPGGGLWRRLNKMTRHNSL